MNNQLSEILGLIRSHDSILITAHVLPDGDSIGSLTGFGLALEAAGKKVEMVMQDPVPAMYRFLRGTEKISLPHQLGSIPKLVIFLDCTDRSRAGVDWSEPYLQDVPSINIDHHVSNSFFASYNLVDPQAAATAEIVYTLVRELSIAISADIASALYTGIVMDTGSFQYESTTPHTLKTAAALLEQGVQLSCIKEHLYEQKSLKNYHLLAEAIGNISFAADGKIAWTYLDQAVMKRLQAKAEDCEGIVSYPISLANVKIGLFFRELTNGEVKVGLRCRTGFDVNKIAHSFGGGGHQLAAGCTVEGPLQSAILRVITVTNEMMEARS
ncbi:DHH family phosphoesterase [Dehalobacterium formicoaceticum]|uniref:Bifunctional oligoribonuclease/PAP phosphatase NrnA n=1 Tax=Dehalobacterium formicoaceticum TaxID=51515 RepID=A0ABT1Y4U2_9FIRM|nr:bifunctional oligoribonuclease/PAP phosphatase NrnA [Dehalobacterium formicoaceticum]MCR6545897.1 bifunctional oligoribonuclease/PAP phosphatase NrnA [Dehalobacterium formicoaceticum]